MKLKSLHLENFRRHDKLDIAFNENETFITKPNFFGKTTILDSILWVLTGKPLTGEKNYSPKPIKNGEEVHGVTSVAEIEFTNGFILKKTFSEKWSTKRGSTEKLFTGNQTECFINDVPYTATDFDRWIDINIANREQLQSLLNPAWWCANKPDGFGWENRRECLLRMLNIDESTLMTPGVSQILMGQSVEDAKKRLKAQMKNINVDITDIPVRIDELNKQLTDIPNENISDLHDKYNLLEKDKEQAIRTINDIESGSDQKMHAQNAVNDAYSALVTAKAEYSGTYQDLVEQANRPVIEATERSIEARHLFERCKAEYDQAIYFRDDTENKIVREEKAFEELRNRYATESAKEYIPGYLHCPTCNQPIPQSQIQSAQEAFNLNKAKVLDEINLMGKSTKEYLEALKVEANAANNKVLICRSNMEAKDQAFRAIVIPVAERIKTFEETEKYMELNNAYLKAKEQSLNVTDTKDLTLPYRTMIEQLNQWQSDIRAKIAQIEYARVLRERVSSLLGEERKLSEMYAVTERQLFLIEQYNKGKISLLNSSIEKQFKSLRFRMWKDNISNDGIVDCCDVMISTPQGCIPYLSGSTSEKIISNLELINVLSKFWNIELFALVDNAEAIQKENRPYYGTQTIWCEVEPPKKENK